MVFPQSLTSIRSEKLVDLFHAAGHVIGMETIRRLDTTIALDIIDRYNTNGHVYIPNELVPYSPTMPNIYILVIFKICFVRVVLMQLSLGTPARRYMGYTQ